MKTYRILIAGFGGQGVLFAGKFLAYKGLCEDKQVSWLPSYGPEMRGGTANCSVIISDELIGSPIITTPDILVAMNLPSLDKYEQSVVPGGQIYLDSTLNARDVTRTDVSVYRVPATQMASDSGLTTLANMIMVGKIRKESGACAYEGLEAALKKVVSARHADLYDANLKAVNMGFNLE